MIACPNCSRGLGLTEYLFSRGLRDPEGSAVAEFGFYTCPNCRANSTKPRVVLHAWGDAHVTAIPDTTDATVYIQLVTRAGREPVSDPTGD